MVINSSALKSAWYRNEQLNAADLSEETSGRAESKACFNSRGNLSIMALTAVALGFVRMRARMRYLLADFDSQAAFMLEYLTHALVGAGMVR